MNKVTSPNTNIRLYYKSQRELATALKDYIDFYFDNIMDDTEFEHKILEVINSNEERFYKSGTKEIATKVELILGKTRTDIISRILKKYKGGEK